MLRTVKLNVLIPLNYDISDFSKSLEETIAVSKAEIDDYHSEKLLDNEKWFHYCFRTKPIEKNFQMANSPLVSNGEYLVSRIELNSVARSVIGLNNNLTSTYRLLNSNATFRIGMIRILLFKNGIGFLHFEVEASNIDCDAARSFVSAFGKIASSRPCFVYSKRISKTETEEMQITFKELIARVVNLQSYIALRLYENRVEPYIQINMIGTCDDPDKMMYFDSIQSMSPRKSTKNIAESQFYYGKEEYISRFVGDRTFCVFGDTAICGDENLDFLMNKNNGLLKTTTENYTSVYAFLASLHLQLKKSDLCGDEAEYVLNAPKRLSDEDNIREFYEQCLWNNGWNLGNLISELRERLKIKNIGKTVRSMSDEIKEIKRIAEETHDGVEYLVDFVNSELKAYIEKEKRIFNSSGDRDTDSGIGRFIEHTSNHINKQIETSGDELIDQERHGLEVLFGDNWQYLMPTSKTSLISAGTLLKKCADIRVPDFDYSGISICCTSALEAELRRVFFDGLIDYMIRTYGYPSLAGTSDINENWPDALLASPRYQLSPSNKAKIKDIFTMGNLPFLFGETGKLSEKSEIRNVQLEQSRLMKSKMAEYLRSITRHPYNNCAFESFYIESRTDDRITCQSGCFVGKCERIRVDYRNKAAHINVVTAKEASLCYQSILTNLPAKSDTYVYNAEIIGVILELFEKIDGTRIPMKLKERNNWSGIIQDNAVNYNIGDIVELVNPEVTTRGGIRGMIRDSSVGVTISPKYLEENGIIARKYIRKTIQVKLVRWDANANKYNAEFAERKGYGDT